jgi:RNA polymerase sigma factor (sigma-70 family)
MEYSDKELLEKFADEATRNYAFNLLVKKYQEKLYWHVRRMVVDHDDADDLVQDIFVKVWKSLEGFREDAKLYTWMYRIATNECITFLNKKKKRIFVPLVDVEAQLSKKMEHDPLFDGDKIQLKLQQAILTLPEKQRVVFHLKYYDEMKYEDMSEVLGTSVGALKASYHHAVKKIEDYMKAL